MAQPSGLRIHGARQNNLKNVSLEIPHDRLTVVTGVSGSGKSSLAFDTLFAEGQWRYIESLSTYARMFLDRVDRPDVDRIEQIRPAVALEQKNAVRTARSTVGTATEVYDYMRLLYAKIGRVHCPACGAAAASNSPETIVSSLLSEHPGARALIMFGLAVPAGLPPVELWTSLNRRGFARVRVNGVIHDLATPPPANLAEHRTISVVLDRVVLESAHRTRIAESVEAALREGGGQVAVEVLDGPTRVFAEDFRCSGCGAALERPQPLLFSFNHPLGACPECKGFGNILRYDEARVVPDRSKSLAEGAVEPWTHPSGKWYQRELMKAARRHKVDTGTPWERLPGAARALVYEGDASFAGVNGFFEEVESYRYKLHVRVFLSRYRSQSPCPTCHGARLKPAALAVRVGGLTIAEFAALTVDAAARLLADLTLTAWEAVVAREILRQLNAKLGFLLRVGLGYLTLSRQTRTLSGGEAPRINLANQLGSQLVGTLYLLDGPAPPRPRRRARAQPQGRDRADPAPDAHGRQRRVGLRQIHACPRHALPRRRARLQDRIHAARRLRRRHRPRVPQGRPSDRPGADRPHAALEPRDLRQGVRRDPKALRGSAPIPGARPRRRRVLVQRTGRAVRVVSGRRLPEARDVLLRGRVRDLPGVRGATVPARRPHREVPRPGHQRRAPHDRGRRRRVLRRPGGARAAAARAPGRRPGLPAPGPARDDAFGRRGPAAQDRRRARRARGERHALHHGRADDGAPPRRRQEAPRRAQSPRGCRQHDPRRRTPPRRHQVGGLRHRPRAGGR